MLDLEQYIVDEEGHTFTVGDHFSDIFPSDARNAFKMIN